MRVVLAAIGLMLVLQAVQLSLCIKVTRRAWALLEQRSDAELQRLGIVLFLLGVLLWAAAA